MIWLRELGYRLRQWFKRDSAEHELGEEVTTHIELQIQEYLGQGLSPAEAQRAARLKFGNTTLTKEDSRTWWSFVWLESLWRDWHYGARSLIRSRVFTTVAVLSMALGIGGTTTVFTVARGLLLRPLPYREPNRLVEIGWDTLPDGGFRDGISLGDFFDLQSRNQVFEDLTLHQSRVREADVVAGESVLREPTLAVAHNFLDLLGVAVSHGRNFAATEDAPPGEPVIIVEEALARRLFVSPQEAVGRQVRLNGQVSTIIGVLPRDFRFYRTYQPQRPSILTTNVFSYTALNDRRMLMTTAIARLRKGVSLEEAQANMDVIGATLAEAYPDTHRNQQTGEFHTLVRPLGEGMAASVRPTLEIMSAAAAVVLLIAGVNLGGLLLVRSTTRRRDIVLRQAMGAGRGRVLRQLLTESLLLATAGGLAGIVLPFIVLPLLTRPIPSWILRVDEIAVDLPVLSFAFAVTLLSGLLFGLVPAWRSSKVRPGEALNDAGRSATQGFGRRRAQNLFVAVQVGLSCALLIGAGLMVRSFLEFQAVPLGFRPERVVAMKLEMREYKYAKKAGETDDGTPLYEVVPEQRQTVDAVLRQLRALPGVVSAAVANYIPMTGAKRTTRFKVAGSEGELENPWAVFRVVTPEYFDTLGIPLLRGQVFSARHSSRDLPVVVINQAMADRCFPNESPIGKYLLMSDSRAVPEKPYQVIGVVGNTKQETEYRRVGWGSGDTIYMPFAEQSETFLSWQIGFRSHVTFLVRSSIDSESLIPDMRRIVEEVDPNEPIANIQSLERVLQDSEDDCCSSKMKRLYGGILLAFGGTALSIALTGIYGVIAYAVSLRTKEIGVRMAVGAKPVQILAMVMRQGLWAAVTGVLVGGLSSLWLSKLIESQLYGVSSADPLTIVSVCGLLMTVALAAGYAAARHATKVDPLTALRHD